MENKISNIKYLRLTLKDIGLKGACLLAFNFIFYSLEYIKKSNEDECGYYLTKRWYMWLLFFPLFFPCYVVFKAFFAIYEYIKFVSDYWQHWIRSEKKKLTFKQKISYRIRLFDDF